MNENKKNTIAWIKEFASVHKYMYTASVILAILGVVCSIVPYFYIGNIIKELLQGNKDINLYLGKCVWMAVFWGLRVLCHSISTTLSHKATFHVLSIIRKRVCEKLTRIPLGYILDIPSGSLKNTLVEKIDSIETTLAHILPEFTSNLLVPSCILVYIFFIDWRMALASLVTIPLGLLCFMVMKIDYEKNYKNTVEKTKKLNDTAVEYISGIEVIKAFGKAQSSYEKFVTAAKEGAECYVEWMRKTSVFFSMAFGIFPSTLITILPIGGMLYRGGSLSAPDFIFIMILSIGIIG